MPQLGFGNSLPKINIINSFSGLFDELGIASNCVYDFSPYKRLTKNYKGNKLYLQRTTDFEKEYIHTSDYDKNGDINSSEIVSWASGGDVLIEEVYSECAVGKKAYQTSLGYKPKLVMSGVFHGNGVLFDGSDDVLSIDDYSALNIINPNITYYSNAIYNTGCNGYLFSKNYNTSSASTYSHNPETSGYDRFRFYNASYDLTIHADSATKYMMYWNSLSANGLHMLNNFSDTFDTTRNTNSTNYTNVNVGARSNSVDNSTKTYFFKGHVKTILLFNTDEHTNYNNFVNGGI